MSSESVSRGDLDSMVEPDDPLGELVEPTELGDDVDEPSDDLDDLLVDESPEGSGELDELALPDSDPVLLVWPREEYEQVDQRWPEVLEPIGADTWDDYRRRYQGLITRWARRGLPPLTLVTGTADGFEEWLTEQGADPVSADFVALAEAYGNELADQVGTVELPPAGGDPCWCGSGLSYGECCQPLSPR